MTESKICTCPSGDGSLRHPCPAHPAAEQAGGDERVIGWRERILAAHPNSDPGFWPDALLVEHMAAEIADLRAALAQPSQAPTEGFTHFPELLESVQQMDAMLKANSAQAEAERPKIVATLFTPNEKVHDDIGFKAFAVAGDCDKDGGEFYDPEKLMTVAQHECIVGELRAVIAQLRQHKNDYMDSGQETYRALQNEIREREAEIARLDGLVSGRTAERDAALARVADMKTMADNYCALLMDANAKLAEMERQEPVALANRGLHAFWVKWTEAAAGLYGPGIKLYAHPVAQAQHSVPELLVRAEDFVSGKEVPQAWLDVQAERRRQITAEGWTPEHDDLYCAAELPRAAAAYILNGANDEAPAIWPFSAKWWKPRDARSNYVRAGALILAEIERLDRAAPGKEGNDD
ncbi:hypothetical protein FA321_07790 [Pseudomonas aeruginosa]|nr:hypothetical protein [Pseudomonas aeruginosa]